MRPEKNRRDFFTWLITFDIERHTAVRYDALLLRLQLVRQV